MTNVSLLEHLVTLEIQAKIIGLEASLEFLQVNFLLISSIFGTFMALVLLIFLTLFRQSLWQRGKR